MIKINANIIPTIVIINWFAPQPKPIAIIKNKYTSSSGSFIAALNLTIDSAPTKPSDSAKELLTIIITIQVVTDRITKFFEKDQMFKKKSMPTMPIGEWIKGPLKDWAIASLEGLDKSRYNVKESLNLLNEHCSDIYDHTRSLRTLLITSAWMSQKPNKH